MTVTITITITNVWVLFLLRARELQLDSTRERLDHIVNDFLVEG
jgi:hypothetical protein